MGLFKLEDVTLHSGEKSFFKIECDALDEEDWNCLGYLVVQKLGPMWSAVVGVPTGGIDLADAVRKHVVIDKHSPVLIVDDVLTTGGSMEEHRAHMMKTVPDLGPINIMGAVAFARGKCPDWVTPLFQM